MQQCNEFRKPLILAFIDYEKAFDSLHRDTLWKILYHYGFPEKYVNIIRAIHHKSRCKVNVDGDLTEEFSVNSGVLQGNVLSPFLFAVAMDYIMKITIRDRNEGIDWKDGAKLCDLEYADDAVLFTHTEADLQTLLNRLEVNSKGLGSSINKSKTEIMHNQFSPIPRLTLENEEIKISEEFKYLGTIITNNGSLEKEFNTRIQRAHQTMGRLHKIWKSNRLSIHTKIRLYTCLVRSVLLYGYESWYDNETISKKYLTFENKALRRIMGIRWQDKIRNLRIREIVEIPRIDQFMMKGRWRWMGHALRADPNRIISQAIDWEPVGTRRRGRPKATYVRTMRREAGERWNDIRNVAQDRNAWKGFCEALYVTRRWSKV